MGSAAKKVKRKSGRRSPKSNNVYLKMLVKLYEYLDKNVPTKFNNKVHKRLCTSNVNKQPVSISRISRSYLDSQKSDDKKSVIAVVARVTNDERYYEIPSGMTVVALNFSKTAYSRLMDAGCETLTFDQYASQSPTGDDAILIKGDPSRRKSAKYFGVASSKYSAALPRAKAGTEKTFKKKFIDRGPFKLSRQEVEEFLCKDINNDGA